MSHDVTEKRAWGLSCFCVLVVLGVSAPRAATAAGVIPTIGPFVGLFDVGGDAVGPEAGGEFGAWAHLAPLSRLASILGGLDLGLSTRRVYLEVQTAVVIKNLMLGISGGVAQHHHESRASSQITTWVAITPWPIFPYLRWDHLFDEHANWQPGLMLKVPLMRP